MCNNDYYKIKYLETQINEIKLGIENKKDHILNFIILYIILNIKH